MDGLSKSFAGYYEFGFFGDSIIGDMSWITGGSIIFVRNNVGGRVCLGSLHPEMWNMLEPIARKMLKKINTNLSPEIISAEQNAQKTRISDEKYDRFIHDAVTSENMKGYSLSASVDSKWLVDDETFVAGKRTEYTNPDSIVIGIDIAELNSEESAQSAAAIRTSYVPAPEALGDHPLVFTMMEESSIDSLIVHWENRNDYTYLSKNILSGISAYRNYAVHIYQYAPHEVDIKLFKEIAHSISKTLPFSIPSSVTEEDTAAETPQVFTLRQNAPNPFNPSTVIGYELHESANVRLTVHD
ncbi:hypothetical protein LLG96_00960, partial [bacterium]|nr:hypothetical protein [bacterium]